MSFVMYHQVWHDTLSNCHVVIATQLVWVDDEYRGPHSNGFCNPRGIQLPNVNLWDGRIIGCWGAL
jgi:hypothetical protein